MEQSRTQTDESDRASSATATQIRFYTFGLLSIEWAGQATAFPEERLRGR